MQAWEFIRKLSQPLKTLYVLWPVSILGAIAATFTGSHDRLALVVFGLVAVATGLTMLTNLNHAAETAATAMAAYRPSGVDYSSSWYATPAYARVFGAFTAMVGAGLLTAALTQH